MNKTESTIHRIRFYCSPEVMERLTAYDGTLIESKVKRVLTGNENQKNILCQFTTMNCGKVTAQQRLITYLINSLTNE